MIRILITNEIFIIIVQMLSDKLKSPVVNIGISIIATATSVRQYYIGSINQRFKE